MSDRWHKYEYLYLKNLKMCPTLSQKYSESRTCHSWSRCNGICLLSGLSIYKQKSDIYRCIRSNRDRLGFYAEIQIIFGTVWRISLYVTDDAIAKLYVS